MATFESHESNDRAIGKRGRANDAVESEVDSEDWWRWLLGPVGENESQGKVEDEQDEGAKVAHLCGAS
jgi:hypothetical protein